MPNLENNSIEQTNKDQGIQKDIKTEDTNSIDEIIPTPVIMTSRIAKKKFNKNLPKIMELISRLE